MRFRILVTLIVSLALIALATGIAEASPKWLTTLRPMW
jgi:hypothetical protein